jgi:hypothetical protein
MRIISSALKWCLGGNRDGKDPKTKLNSPIKQKGEKIGEPQHTQGETNDISDIEEAMNETNKEEASLELKPPQHTEAEAKAQPKRIGEIPPSEQEEAFERKQLRKNKGTNSSWTSRHNTHSTKTSTATPTDEGRSF